MALGPPARAVNGEAFPFSKSNGGRSAQQVVAGVAESRRVHEAFAWFRANARLLEDLQLAVSAIPAPPWGEAARSEWLRARFAEFTLADVHIDEIGNVFAVHPGTDPNAPYIALSAHIDTVFPEGTDVAPRREAGKLYGPGISDNASGITAVLAIAGALSATALATAAPVLLIGNVGEEGEGDLRGVRHIFHEPRWARSIATLVALDGAGTDTIISEGLGSRRYELTVSGPGGHSWSDFGLPNPILAMARIIEHFGRTPVPTLPKTTFNIGTIHGGTSVNSIPQSATIRVDTRSASVIELDRMERALREAIDEILPQMKGRKRQEALRAEVRVIGNRPAADLASDAHLLKMIRAVDAHLKNQSRVQRASTDANIPLSLGREAIAIGAGGSGGGAHTLSEWYDPAGRELGLKRILLLTLALAGLVEESDRS